MPTHREQLVEFRRATPADAHHYFGYYDKFPWDATGRYLLALSPPFIDRMPVPGDVVKIGMVDLENAVSWIPLAESRAWNWQQGIMLHWLHIDPERTIIYNDLRDGAFVSVVRDVFSDEERVLPRPVYCLRPDGKEAMSVNFGRIARTRPGYGYEGVPDPGEADPHPAEDGIWALDLESGEHRLIITLDQAAKLEPKPDMEGCEHWFNHLQYCTDGSRFLFLHRWKKPGETFRATRLLTANPDGTDIRIIADDGMTSHFDWRDERTILAWARVREEGDYYYLFDGLTGDHETVGAGILTTDGHCSYSPDRKWILTDTYPDKERKRTLILYRPDAEERIDVGRFYAPPELDGPLRTDLHPRWSRDGKSVCLDSVHETRDGKPVRQMYIADVSEIVS